MGLKGPPPAPFEGMAPAERKRAQESVILELVYGPRSAEVDIRPGERPDFTLVHSGSDSPHGVEVTQLFPNESMARLNLIHGYHHHLWSGGDHFHKDDREVLNSVRVNIRDKDGNVKHTDMPAIIVENPATPIAFRSALREAIRTKSAKGYDTDGTLRHINLVILDWFCLSFDPNDYFSDHFFDDDVRRALRECPFREVLTVVATSRPKEAQQPAEAAPPADPTHHPAFCVVPLQELLLMERVFVTGHMIDQEFREHLRSAEHLNRLVVDHVTRVQGYGEPVDHDGSVYVRYGASMVQVNERGMLVLESRDFPADQYPTAKMDDRMDVDTEERVTELVSDAAFGGGYTWPAFKPSTWLDS